jgi:hypothetical protein
MFENRLPSRIFGPKGHEAVRDWKITRRLKNGVFWVVTPYGL